MRKRVSRAIERLQEAKKEHLMKKKSEVERVKEEGIKFPSYNPLPKKKEELTKKERKAAQMLRYKEYERKRTPNKVFIGWEYKDRYSYRKND